MTFIPNLTPDTIKSAIIASLPTLEHHNCASGLFRLKMMVSEPYVAVGYYFRKGFNLQFTYLDGMTDFVSHKNLFDMVWDSIAAIEGKDACGYFFVLESDKPDCLEYTHYYIALR